MTDSNITLRKKTIRKETSYESLPCINNSSLLSEDSNLMRSLPDLSTVQNDEIITELRNTIDNLNLKLECADNEIDKLILENKALRQTTTDQDIKIKELIKICSSTSKSNSAKSSKQKLLKRRINFTTNGLDNSLTMDNTSYQSPSFPPNMIMEENSLPPRPSTSRCNHQVFSKSDLDKPHQETGTVESRVKQHIEPTHSLTRPTSDNKSSTLSMIGSSGKIMIYGTQQCSGLASKLIGSREGTKPEKYLVSSITKHYAKSNEVLKGCDSLIMSEKDKIILCVGENDTNPTDSLAELCYVLKKLQNNTVFLLKVVNNRYLNECMLNKQFKLICNIFPNCHFVNLTGETGDLLQETCESLNYKIDCMDYNEKFLTYNKLHVNPLSLKHVSVNGVVPQNGGNIGTSSKKYTQQSILHYFSRINKPRPLSTKERHIYQSAPSLNISTNSYVQNDFLTIKTNLNPPT